MRADDLGAIPLRALMARNPEVDWAAVSDVIYGCANQAGEDNRNVAHMSSLLAGLPIEVPGSTVNRLCGSGMDATGSAKSMAAAYNFVGFTGRLVWVGITQDPITVTQPLMHRREMTFLASRNALSAEFTRIIRLIEGGMIDTPSTCRNPAARPTKEDA